jgi:radical SAM protein with 4Fe4S-binding SPASM domain
MDNRIKIRPSECLFTGHLSNEKAYILSIEKHSIKKFYWIEQDFKTLLDAAILNGSLSLDFLPSDELHALLFLAANGLIEFAVDGERFSKTLSRSNFHSKKGILRQVERQFNSILYKTNTPFSVKLELTTVCNLKCKYCYMRGAKNTMIRGKQWVDVLERLRKLGVVRLELTGGEPLLHEDLPQIIKAVDGMGFDTTICTNGALIDRSFTKTLQRSRNVDVRISYHSVDEVIFDQFVQVEGTYSKVMQSFDILLDGHAPFSAFIVLTSVNQDKILDTIEYFKKAGIEYDVSALLFPNLYTLSDNYEYRPSFEIVNKLIKEKYLKKQEAKCSALRTKFWISCNGDVFPCEMYRRFKIGNIFEEDFPTILNSKMATEFKDHVSRNFSSCGPCEHASYCGHCPALCEIYSKSLASLQSRKYEGYLVHK